FPHQFVRFAEIIFVHFHFHVCLRLRHESNSLQMTIADDVGADPCLSQPVAEMFRFRLLVEGCDRDHGFAAAWPRPEQTTFSAAAQDWPAETIDKALNKRARR